MSATPAALREALISGRAHQGLLKLMGRSALSFQKKPDARAILDQLPPITAPGPGH